MDSVQNQQITISVNFKDREYGCFTEEIQTASQMM